MRTTGPLPAGQASPRSVARRRWRTGLGCRYRGRRPPFFRGVRRSLLYLRVGRHAAAPGNPTPRDERRGRARLTGPSGCRADDRARPSCCAQLPTRPSETRVGPRIPASSSLSEESFVATACRKTAGEHGRSGGRRPGTRASVGCGLARWPVPRLRPTGRKFPYPRRVDGRGAREKRRVVATWPRDGGVGWTRTGPCHGSGTRYPGCVRSPVRRPRQLGPGPSPPSTSWLKRLGCVVSG